MDIDWFLDHARENVYPSREELCKRLKSGAKITAYLGIDPTGPSLHLGHVIPMMKLAELQKLGHKVILLIGDFTAMIGDPTDKSATRRPLTREQVLENCKHYKQQASKILDFTGPNAAELKFNSAWLDALTFKNTIELASCFTVQQMLERDMFKKRMTKSKPIHMHEFFYPLMQGYDSVAMDVDLEIGGNDQTFNMLAGRDLMKIGVLGHKPKEKFVLTTKLLADPTGKKMGKTEGNMITLDDAPEDVYGKVMNWTDDMIVPGFEILTDCSPEEIKKRLKKGENPMALKHELARQIVAVLHDEKAAAHAASAFESVHQKHEKPEEIKEIKIKHKEVSIVDAVSESKLVASKSEARRQIEQGGVKVDGETIKDVNAKIVIGKTGVVIQKGKRHFVKLVL